MNFGEIIILSVSAAMLLGMILLVTVGLRRLDRASAGDGVRLRDAYELLLKQIWRDRYQG